MIRKKMLAILLSAEKNRGIYSSRKQVENVKFKYVMYIEKKLLTLYVLPPTMKHKNKKK